MNRRNFLYALSAAAASSCAGRGSIGGGVIMTVTGPIRAADAGVMLPHEHIITSWPIEAPYDPFTLAPDSPQRYDGDEVARIMLPYLMQAKAVGVRTIADTTPLYLGRDPVVLERLSRASGIHILTNTGYYGARNDVHAPPHAHAESADQLAARWIREARDGIGETGIRPGFIKISVDPGPLSELDAKLVRAAARTHRATGLTIASHTGSTDAAFAQLDILAEEGVPPSAWIWVHAQFEERDFARHVEAARRGAWVEFDGLGHAGAGNSAARVERHAALILNMQRNGVLDRTLVSHDSGWYNIGEPNGGAIGGYTLLFDALIPALQRAGLADEEIRQLTSRNPARAFAVPTLLERSPPK